MSAPGNARGNGCLRRRGRVRGGQIIRRFAEAASFRGWMGLGQPPLVSVTNCSARPDSHDVPPGVARG